MHTPLCGHARGHPLEYLQTARDQGIRLITFTCHIPMASEGFGGPGIRMNVHDLPRYRALVEEAREEGKKVGIEVLHGIEAEIFPDEQELVLMDRILREHAFDFILGSVHHQVQAYQDWLEIHGLYTDEEIIAVYFDHLAGGAESGRYHSLSHPDVIRLYGTLQGRFDPHAHRSVICKALDRIAETGICMEVNTSGRIKGDYVMHPDPIILDWIVERGIPLTLGSDAHTPEMVGQCFGESLQILASKGVKILHYFRSGERFPVPLEAL